MLRDALAASLEKEKAAPLSIATAPVILPPVLSKIRTLNLSRCSRLTAVPGQLVKLKTLSIACTDFDDDVRT